MRALLLLTLSMFFSLPVPALGAGACFQHNTIAGCKLDPCCKFTARGQGWVCNQAGTKPLRCRAKLAIAELKEKYKKEREFKKEQKSKAPIESLVSKPVADCAPEEVIALKDPAIEIKPIIDEFKMDLSEDEQLLVEAEIKYPYVRPEFVVDSTSYKDIKQARSALKELADFLIKHPRLTINLMGVTDTFPGKYSDEAHEKNLKTRDPQLNSIVFYKTKIEDKDKDQYFKSYSKYSKLLALARALTVAETLKSLGVSDKQIKNIDGAEPGENLLVENRPPNKDPNSELNRRVDIEFDVSSLAQSMNSVKPNEKKAK